jgi:hypothetical protein
MHILRAATTRGTIRNPLYKHRGLQAPFTRGTCDPWQARIFLPTVYLTSLSVTPRLYAYSVELLDYGMVNSKDGGVDVA